MNNTDQPLNSIPFELDCLTNAHRYQEWMISAVRPYLGKKIIELGAGIGNMSKHLPAESDLILTEVDPYLFSMLDEASKKLPRAKAVRVDPEKSLSYFFPDEAVDTIVSFNVFEHVEKDWLLAKDCIDFLRSRKTAGTKRLVTVVPAHPFAFGEIDKTFQHFRRYSDATYRNCLIRAGAELNRKNYFSRYMNIPGLLAWVLRSKLMKSKNIGKNSIETFEALCPYIKPVDDILHLWLKVPFGNSLIAVHVVE